MNETFYQYLRRHWAMTMIFQMALLLWFIFGPGGIAHLLDRAIVTIVLEMVILGIFYLNFAHDRRYGD